MTSRERLAGDAPQGLHRWFARLHWILVASVATTQLVSFTGGIGQVLGAAVDDPAETSHRVPVRRLARPSQSATAQQTDTPSDCAGIRLGEVLLDPNGKPSFATLGEAGQPYRFPRRIGDRMGGVWEVSKLSLVFPANGGNAAEARVELTAGPQSCTLATRRVRAAGYSAAL